jgi:hypothetical protein
MNQSGDSVQVAINTTPSGCPLSTAAGSARCGGKGRLQQPDLGDMTGETSRGGAAADGDLTGGMLAPGCLGRRSGELAACREKVGSF